jgi:hypothetical protein
MKKTILVILVIVILVLTACSGKQQPITVNYEEEITHHVERVRDFLESFLYFNFFYDQEIKMDIEMNLDLIEESATEGITFDQIDLLKLTIETYKMLEEMVKEPALTENSKKAKITVSFYLITLRYITELELEVIYGLNEERKELIEEANTLLREKIENFNPEDYLD